MIWGQKPTHRPVSAGVRQLVRTLFACSVLGRAEHLAFCEETAGQTVILLRLAAKVLYHCKLSAICFACCSQFMCGSPGFSNGAKADSVKASFFCDGSYLFVYFSVVVFISYLD